MIRLFSKTIRLPTRLMYSFANVHRSDRNNQPNMKKGSTNPSRINPKVIQNTAKDDFTKTLKEADKLYGKQVAEILRKKSLEDFDLVFILNSILNNQVHVDEQLCKILKTSLLSLQRFEAIHSGPILELAEYLGILHPPQFIVKAFISHANESRIDVNSFKTLPASFIKKIGYELVEIAAKRNFSQMIEVLKRLGQNLSPKDLKKVDQICKQKISSMTLENIVDLFTVLRQLRKHGEFIEAATQTILQRADELKNRELLSASFSFLELQNIEAFQQLEGVFRNKLNVQTVDNTLVNSFIQLMHKFKVGLAQTWKVCRDRSNTSMNNRNQNLFAIISGLHRSGFQYDIQLFLSFLALDEKLTYVQNLNENQFIELFIVLYANLIKFPQSEQQKQLMMLLKSAISKKKLSSVYNEIQNFFMFLLQTQKNKKADYLSKSYPNELLLSLLSVQFPMEVNIVDIKQKEAYIKHFHERYEAEVYNQNRLVITIEEFVRFKLASLIHN